MTHATEFHPAPHVSTFRRMAAAMWNAPADPSIHGSMDIDVTRALAFIEEHRARTGTKLTITHLVAHAVARAFAEHPELNAKVHGGGRILERKTVDLFVSVATDGGRDLSGARLDRADTLSLDEIAEATTRGARDIREDRDARWKQSRSLVSRAPSWLVRPLLRAVDYATNELHLHLPALGMPRDPFGSAVITNVGMFGIDTAFAPLVPLGRCPMLLLVPTITDRPWAVDGRVEVRPVLRLCATFDHRVIDGAAAGRLARSIRSTLENPAGTSEHLHVAQAA